MRPRLLALLLFLAAALPLPAAPDQPSVAAVRAEITTVVEGQLAAFRANDIARAYTFAAIDIRNMFPLEQFEKMVKGSYPVIAKSKSAEFGICLDDGDQAVVNVTIEGTDGTRKQFQYSLVKEEKGWRISGVADLASQGSRA